MARRYDHSREELYDLALMAAREIVEVEGVDGLSARGIAEKIGYSAGTLYNVFENLADLIMHLNVQALDALYEDLRQLDLDVEPEAAALVLANGYIDFTRKHPNLWNMLFAPYLPKGLALPEWHQERILKLLSLLERALTPLFAPGQEDERLHTARVLWSSLHGMCALESSDRLAAEESIKTMVSSLVTYYMAGLRAHRG